MRIKKKWVTLLTSFFIVGIVSAQPIINSLLPASGPVDTLVTIIGTNFNLTPADNIVFFGSIKAAILNSSATTITVTVPAGATTNYISVTTNNFTAYSNQKFVVTFTGGNKFFFPGSFSPYVTFGSKDYWSMTTCDIDGDSKVDIAVGSPNEAFIEIYKNDGIPKKIKFLPDVHIGYSWRPRDVCYGDLDGDGKQDIVFTADSDDALSVCRNTSTSGAISFSPFIKLSSTCNYQFGVCIKDIDGDGKPDITYVDCQNNINVYRNISTPGNISFESRVTFNVGSSLFLAYMCIADMDGDNKPDIVLTAVSGNSICAVPNTSVPGGISFAQAKIFAAGNYPRFLSIDDFDKDGKIDIAVAAQESNVVNLFRNISNLGNINFTKLPDLPTGNQPWGIATGDLNGDGLTDIAITNAGDKTVSVYTNTFSGGNISFSNKVDYSVYGTPYCINIGDYDNDKKPDIAVAATNNYYGAISILRNKINEPTLKSFSPANSYTGYSVTIKGSNFLDVSSLSFGGIPALSFVINSDSVITAVVGQGGRSGNVTIANAYGSDSLAGFIFTPPPSIIDFNPKIGTTGTGISISGANFVNVTSVKIGGVESPYFSVYSSNNIYATVGAGASGSISVTTVLDSTAKAGFTYVFPPVINSFTPTTAGTGSAITITGKYFTAATSVKFGSLNATSFTVVSPDTIIAIVGGVSSGNLSVVTPGGTAQLSGFIHSGPTINNFIATDRCMSQGVTITIKGTNFSTATTVNVGGVAASNFTVISDTVIDAVAGTVLSPSILIATLNGSATYSLPAANIQNVTPDSGIAGTSVTIKGQNFCKVAYVKFGNKPARSFTVLSDSVISAVVDNGSSSYIYLSTWRGYVSYYGFTYTGPSINYYTAARTSIGDDINLYGNNFLGVTSVKFGGVEASSFNQQSPTFIRCVLAKGASGLIEVTGANGTATLSGFVYSAPDKITLCPPTGSNSLTSDITGSVYQWQQYKDTSFINLANDFYYNGAAESTLKLNNIPSLWYGNIYRCMVNGNRGMLFEIQFSNSWIGTLNTDWENLSNWSCGVLPDENTDVVINSGTIFLNSNAVIRSLKLGSTANLSVTTGHTLTILH